jgi:FAD/FMN-containing dehydrogenase
MAVSTSPRSTLPSDAIDALRRQITGHVLLSGEDGYLDARTVWNGMIDRSPTVIVQPESTADVVATVRFAGEHDLPIAVRGGGHNAAGLAVCDHGLMIDLSRMRAVEVDPERRIARAQGGTRWGDFDAATQAHGLATTGGAISTTGIAGLTLGGGLGNLMRSYGLACDNLISAEVVTADGDIVTASVTENPDLFWGLRGGGGNFGVVTELEYQLYPLSEVLGGLLIFPVDRARDLFRLYRQVTETAPDALGTTAVLTHAPDGTPVCAVLICYNGPIDEGERVIKPFRDFGEPIVNAVGPMPYTAIQSIVDEGFQAGMNNYWRSHFLTDLTDEGIDILVDHFSRVASPLSAILIEDLGGAVARVGRDETAFNFRNYTYNLAILGRWADASEADANIAWTRAVHAAMQSYAAGVYVNYLSVGEQNDRVRQAYGEEKYDRLVELKNRYDPGNRFCFNQNIPPSA